MKCDFNWEQAAIDLGSIKVDSDGDSFSESGGIELGRMATLDALGPGFLEGAVEHYLTYKPGSELARSTLNFLHSRQAAEYCHQIWSSSRPDQERVRAVELVRSMAGVCSAEWVALYLGDANECIQNWGASLLDRMLLAEALELSDCGDLLTSMSQHPNATVQELAARILEDYGPGGPGGVPVRRADGCLD